MRSYAKVFTSINADEDFSKLSIHAQWVYLRLLASQDISHVGVLVVSTKKWSHWSRQSTQIVIRRALASLQRAQYVVLDDTTDEVWVRTFMRWDGILMSPNMKKAAAVDFARVVSPALRAQILASIPEDDRPLFTKGFPKPFAEPFEEPMPYPTNHYPLSTNHSVEHTPRTQIGGRADTLRVCVSNDDHGFAAIFDGWPRSKRGARRAASAAYDAALRRAGEAKLVNDAATDWLRYWASENIADRYVPKLVNWLSDDSWTNPVPQRAASSQEVKRNHAVAELQAFIDRGDE